MNLCTAVDAVKGYKYGIARWLVWTHTMALDEIDFE